MIKTTKYDRLLRKILKLKRQKNGFIACARCGKSYPVENSAQVHVSHFFGRANWTTRLLEENVDFHCYGCHSFFEQNPHHHREWKFKQLGRHRYESLVQQASRTIMDAYGMKKRAWLDMWYSEKLKELKELEEK